MLHRLAVFATALTLAACSGGSHTAGGPEGAPPEANAPVERPAEASGADIYPFEAAVRDFPNGLRAVVVPTGLPDIVSVQIVMGTGSRDEVEPGRSGFAHFFEHMMFRGTETMSADAYQTALKQMGGDQNAYTSDDRTVYHTTLLAEDLDQMLAMEADRFQNLSYSEADFRTEALAVLGEYNKNVANPIQKLFEVQRKAAYRDHTYRHTTMGFLEDIEAMPEAYDYAQSFFDRFYRPENAVVLIAGDVAPEATFALIEKHFGAWERGYTPPNVPTERPLAGPLYEHVDWAGPTPPWVTVAFRGPAAYPTDDNAASGDMQALDVISSLGFGPSSPLYQRLVVEEQVADVLAASFPDSRDPGLLTVLARVTDPADAAYVRDEIQKELARLTVQPPEAAKLADLKSALTYGFAAGLDNTKAIADAIVPVLSVTRDPQTLNEIYRTYASITPEAVREVAARTFTDRNMVVVTLAQGALSPQAMAAGSVDTHVAEARRAYEGTQRGNRPPMASDMSGDSPRVPLAPGDPEAVRVLPQPSPSPLVSLRLQFASGAADDPEGKEGLAAITAQMITDAGSRTRYYSEIQQALFPLAAGIGAQVDKEVTTLAGTVHRDNLEAYWDVVGRMILEPGFRQEDFSRVKTQTLNAIRTGLRAGNDEELGKEVLYERLYAGHPYGHLNAGHAEAVDALTLDDVRRFYREHYTLDRLTLGVAGDISDADLSQIRANLAMLPASGAARAAVPDAPEASGGLAVTLVEKPDARAVAISMGHPIGVTREHPDFVALDLVRSWLGEHRNSSAHLFQRIREVRGMNYGDYAYIEYYPGGMFSTMPPAGLARSSQIFQVWIRPVPPEQAHFALRIAKYELDKLVADGLSQEDFENTRAFLSKYVALLVSTQGRRLGYTQDQTYYGLMDYVTWYRSELAALTLADVNRAIREHITPDRMDVVMIAPNAGRLHDELILGTPSPMTYASEKSPEVLAEDAIIEVYDLDLAPGDVTVIPVENVFERPVFE
ncbi:M16 family metallopeptidase [Rubricoccus marinus]|uniref:Peptidase M16 n=1 Tax=Rubricoccus marinus TaxID=716817 RepID=A0A259TY52_9BACT|nr:pitrilysin family protein [Rubricoccus marinus]OZC02679.1 hypothetical protein BSZ36_06640 [Rubricoccus marinus]